MLESLPFEGTIKVKNKGVDAAILADHDCVDMAFSVSRKLVVCGISTAVLEVTCLDPVDTKTLAYYEATTGGLLTMNADILAAVRPHLKPETKLVLFTGTTEQELFQAVRKL